jgi:hypothetical protein
MAMHAKINTHFVKHFASFVETLSKAPEGDGTVLDHTLLHLASDMRTHDHDAYDLPMLLVGGTGFIKQNGHMALAAAPSDRQARDLYYTFM